MAGPQGWGSVLAQVTGPFGLTPCGDLACSSAPLQFDSHWPDSNRRTMALPTELQREYGGFRSESNRSPEDRFYRPAPEPSGIRTRICALPAFDVGAGLIGRDDAFALREPFSRRLGNLAGTFVASQRPGLNRQSGRRSDTGYVAERPPCPNHAATVPRLSTQSRTAASNARMSAKRR